MRVQDLSWPQYEERITTHTVVLPIGAIEAHGPHLPLSTDTVIATYLAEQLDARIPALVLPPIPFGVKTDPVRAGGEFPGMTNLRASTMTQLVLDVLTASYRHGARRFLVLHGHIANLPVVHEAAELFLAQAPGAKVMAAAWWDFAPEDTRNDIARENGVARSEDNHAAMVETSLMMHIAPHQVREHLLADDTSERRVRYLILPVPDALKTRTGVIYQAGKASADIGHRLLPEIIDQLVQAVNLELGDE
ncbi:creatinine amidohydrolase [Kitasatospora sp. MAP12-15]|uniref:creatininase family protein n=1 Tax=unclassified Kitasatospora TaxID=2633591 RepID=UPI002473F6EF|nr:creatininase family protein [Kitasatospora sp. MAP12-44]MDH6114191.1 creatinine amidohydrolase [Kitasatospora sp. MAP12-44]